MNQRWVPCPNCSLMVRVIDGTYDTHYPGPTSTYCFMSGMPEPITVTDEDSLESLATIVSCLAVDVQDGDPQAVWRYLSVAPDMFVRQMLQLALAGLNVEGKRVQDIWRKWVKE